MLLPHSLDIHSHYESHREALQANRPKGSSVENSVTGPRKYLIGGNWKCNGLYDENVERIKVFNEAGPIPSNVEVVLCVPYIHIPMALSMLRDDIEVGAQNSGNNTSDGAFTGEIGAHQLKDIGCTWVIIGHSERRDGFGMAGEPEALCAEKCKVALDAGLKVMFAIGEKKEEREAGTTMDVCAKQLEPLAKVLEPKDWPNVAIAVSFFCLGLFVRCETLMKMFVCLFFLLFEVSYLPIFSYQIRVFGFAAFLMGFLSLRVE
jgi:Triosephosphate isomerase